MKKIIKLILLIFTMFCVGYILTLIIINASNRKIAIDRSFNITNDDFEQSLLEVKDKTYIFTRMSVRDWYVHPEFYDYFMDRNKHYDSLKYQYKVETLKNNEDYAKDWFK